MFKTIREYLDTVRPDPQPGCPLLLPDMENSNASATAEYRVNYAFYLHLNRTNPLPGTFLNHPCWFQVNLVFVEHLSSLRHYAFIIASIQDHEGPFQEIVPIDGLLDCTDYESFKDCLYAYSLDCGFDLTIERPDCMIDVMPEWFSVPA